MSLNNTLNGVLAYIENRPDIAREIFRAPGSDVKDVPGALARIDRAVNRAAAQAILNALKRSLRVQVDPVAIRSTWLEANDASGGECGEYSNEANAAVFLLGVRRTEIVFENVLAELEES